MSARRKAMPLHDRLAELREAIVTAKQRAREVALEHRAAQAEVERIGEARVEAFAAGDEQAAERLQTERVNAERSLRDFTERAAGAERAVQRAEAEQAQHVTHNFDGLMAERGPEAQAAADAVTAAVDALQASHAQWQAVEARTLELLRLAGRGHERNMPLFPPEITEAVRRTGQAGSVPVPLPREPQFATISPELREAARAKVAEEA